MIPAPVDGRLHTDVLEDKYGQIIAQVIRHDDKIREANLIDKRGISRTFALTFFPKKKFSEKIIEIDGMIRGGVPIGKAFRSQGYGVRKNTIDVFVIKLPEWLRLSFATREEYAKARLSEFYAKSLETKPELYGAVVEIFSPDFKPPVITNLDISTINASTQTLEKMGFKRQEIWKRIGRDNDWLDVRDKYMKAKKMSLPLVFELKERVNNYLKERA